MTTPKQKLDEALARYDSGELCNVHGKWNDIAWQAAREYSRVLADGGWRPIETAPKNGTEILVYWSYTYRDDKSITEGIDKAWWSNDCWETADNDFARCVTHWMPLPAPPTSHTRGKRGGGGMKTELEELVNLAQRGYEPFAGDFFRTHGPALVEAIDKLSAAEKRIEALRKAMQQVADYAASAVVHVDLMEALEADNKAGGV